MMGPAPTTAAEVVQTVKDRAARFYTEDPAAQRAVDRLFTIVISPTRVGVAVPVTTSRSEADSILGAVTEGMHTEPRPGYPNAWTVILPEESP